MTRFGMTEPDFQELAQLFVDVVLNNKTVKEEVGAFRERFLDMQFCFKNEELEGLVEKLYQLI